MYGLWFIGLYCAGSTLGNFVRRLGFRVYIYELIGMYGLWFIGLYCAGSTLGNFVKP